MKKVLVLLISSALFSACSTILVKNPDNVTQGQVAQQDDTIHSTAAATSSDLDRARELAQEASKHIKFDSGRAELKPAAVSALKELASVLSSEHSAKIAISGFTDSSGGEKINRPLSVERARAVSAVLLNNGLKKDQLVLKGNSSKKPIANNDTVDGRAQNRRAEISLQ